MKPPKFTIYTDGACTGNPGPGGYGVVIKGPDKAQELSGGFALTTNNRMELLAVILGLKALKEASEVTLFSDSKYVVDAINQEWVFRWQTNKWKRNKRDKAENVDLWKQLLPLLKKHTVSFKWVKGHAGDPANERCDTLAVTAAKKKSLPPDKGYGEKSKQASLF